MRFEKQRLARLAIDTFTPSVDAVTLITCTGASQARIAKAAAAIIRRCELLGDAWNVGVVFLPGARPVLIVAPYRLGFEERPAVEAISL